MSGATARKPWRTARIDLPADVLKGRPLGRPFFLFPLPLWERVPNEVRRAGGLSPGLPHPPPPRFVFTPIRLSPKGRGKRRRLQTMLPPPPPQAGSAGSL